MARQDSDHLWGFGLRRTSARLGSEIEPKCLILISNLELQLKPAATAGFSSNYRQRNRMVNQKGVLMITVKLFGRLFMNNSIGSIRRNV